MKIFKEIMWVMCRYFATFGFGWATADLFQCDYGSAAWVLFVVSIVFGIGYFTERLSK
jgi:hypothetical protein